MTTGEARVLETDVVIFSAGMEQKGEYDALVENTSSDVKIEKETNKIELKERFARLKKSLRKRSVSIL